MNKNRKKAEWPIVMAVLAAVVLMPLAFYFVSYFAIGKVGTALNPSGEIQTWRLYSSQWQADIFWPAARVESFLSRRDVFTGLWRIPQPTPDQP